VHVLPSITARRNRQTLLSKSHPSARKSSGKTQHPTRATTFARNLFSEAAAGFSSLGELCVLLGLLLLLRLAARSGSSIWSWRRDLNPRPSDYKSDALPAELRQRAMGIMAHAPIEHSSPRPLGQTLRLTQGLCPCNLTSNQRKTLKPFDFASNGDPQLATPAGLVAGILLSTPAIGRRCKAVRYYCIRRFGLRRPDHCK
jgi:hypothetical protein